MFYSYAHPAPFLLIPFDRICLSWLSSTILSISVSEVLKFRKYYWFIDQYCSNRFAAL